MPLKHLFRVSFCAAFAVLTAGCMQNIPPHLKPLSADAMHLMGERGMAPKDPIFVRIFKAESELEVWKQSADGRFYHFKTYPICNWSGELGPKLVQGDKQSPEGFYTVSRPQMNPNSQFHLSFNLGYPNVYDASHKRTGAHLMVHGDCRSAGCYAMTDSLVEEIYALAREAFAGGQEKFHVHAFPFRMTDENLKAHRKHRWAPFWAELKPGYDFFEATRTVPDVHVCGRRYLVGVEFVDGVTRLNPDQSCPPYRKVVAEAFAPPPERIASPVVLKGRKVRNYAELMPVPGSRPSGAYGLTTSASGNSLFQSLLPGLRLGATRAQQRASKGLRSGQ
ncbi:MAG: hypothetical protein GC150_12680 [Rhizobiales bacterium]|nr:hypothetical protein [Hyphomicrobiales bacterium]